MMKFKREYVFTVLFILIVIGGAFAIRQTLLGGKVEEQSQISMEQAVKQSLAGNPSSQNIDFKLTDIFYTKDRYWAVANIVPLKNEAADPDIVIFHFQNGAYEVYRGPSSNFPSNTVQDLPSEVIDYLKSINAVGGPAENHN